MNTLIILAFNEELNIEKTIYNNVKYFDSVIVVNDKSTDNTGTILKNISLDNSKLIIINNNKNFGPGRSMQLGIEKAIEIGSDVVVKIDGDNQFDSLDVKELLELSKKNSSDFIKCDRFWSSGITGDIPKIRFLGNSFASFLVKATSGNRNISDPLNGLFLFSKKFLKYIEIPKFFNRYGYPFYINLLAARKTVSNELNIHQYRNKITYGTESSKLNPITVLFKLLFYSIYFLISNTKHKLKYSNYQLSGVLDIFSYIMFSFSQFSLLMFISTRYLNYNGNQSAWFILFLLFTMTFISLIIQSHKSIREDQKSKFIYLN